VVCLGGPDIQRLEGKIDTVMDAIADLRVLVAGNYVTKTDLLEYQKIEEARIVALHKKIDDNKTEEKADRWKMAALVATIVGIIVAAGQWITEILRGGGAS